MPLPNGSTCNFDNVPSRRVGVAIDGASPMHHMPESGAPENNDRIFQTHGEDSLDSMLLYSTVSGTPLGTVFSNRLQVM